MATPYNRVKVATSTVGTGTVTLGSASSDAFCTFAEAGAQDADVVTYCIEEGLDFEIGRGTYTSSGTTLSRDTVLLSKLAGSSGTTKMTLAGAATVRIVAAAEDLNDKQPFDADTLKADTTDDLTAGFTSSSVDQGTKSSGTFTPAFATGNVQHYTNGGAHTLAPPSSGNGSLVIDMTNNVSAGAVTTSGFTKVTGDTITTTNTHKFRFFITCGNAGSHLHKQAMQ